LKIWSKRSLILSENNINKNIKKNSDNGIKITLIYDKEIKITNYETLDF
jgi:hypothetical protein